MQKNAFFAFLIFTALTQLCLFPSTKIFHSSDVRKVHCVFLTRFCLKYSFLLSVRAKTEGLKHLNGYHDLSKIYEIDFVVSPKQTFPTASEDSSSGY